MESDRLDLDGPDEVLTSERLAVIGARKAEIMALTSSTKGEPVETCRVCGEALKVEETAESRHSLSERST
ncbi:MAG: hypothetical protein J2P21_05280 [Chloracidobacterium sp.]|nr:hypothetical protein [Chloracidobacterium sp.]